jgi:hypothetical protein
MRPEIIKNPLLFPLSVYFVDFVVIHRISAFRFQHFPTGHAGAAELVRSGQAPKRNQAGLENRPVLLVTDFVSNYAVRVLRRIRSALAPKGSSSKAPAIIVVGSGTALGTTLPPSLLGTT